MHVFIVLWINYIVFYSLWRPSVELGDSPVALVVSSDVG